MKTLIAALAALVLSGCSGEAFTGFTPGDPSSADADSTTPADGGLDVKISAGGSGGLLEEDGGPGSGGAKGSGGVVVAAGGSTVAGSGGATSTGGSTAAGSGGSPSTGGMLGSGGVGTGGVTATGGTTACALVTHTNGTGQTWQDCVPIGTWDESQAMRACKASGAALCTAVGGCGVSSYAVCGHDLPGMQQHGGCWEYGSDLTVAYVSATACPDPNDPSARTWR